MAKQVAEGAMSFRDKCAEEVMIPLEDVYMLSAETRLGYSTIREIFETGFSRVPVFGKTRHDYMGLLYTKDLMLADPEDEMRLGDFITIFHRKVQSFFKDTKLSDALNILKKGGTHIGLVRQVNTEVDTAPRFEIAGLLTLEDIMEEIIQAEIVDETDVYVDVDLQIRVGDGRETARLNLGVFDPVWKTRSEESLSRDEVAAVAAHLRSAAFGPGADTELSQRAVEYVVATSEVRTQKRHTPLGVDEPEAEDCLYECGKLADHCTLVLQGRVCVSAGRDKFRSEAGAFSILAKDALLSEDCFRPDFSAHLSTAEVRYMHITRGLYQEAKSLDQDEEALNESWSTIKVLAHQDTRRREARRLTAKRQAIAEAAAEDVAEEMHEACYPRPRTWSGTSSVPEACLAASRREERTLTERSSTSKSSLTPLQAQERIPTERTFTSKSSLTPLQAQELLQIRRKHERRPTLLTAGSGSGRPLDCKTPKTPNTPKTPKTPQSRGDAAPSPRMRSTLHSL